MPKSNLFVSDFSMFPYKEVNHVGIGNAGGKYLIIHFKNSTTELICGEEDVERFKKEFADFHGPEEQISQGPHVGFIAPTTSYYDEE